MIQDTLEDGLDPSSTAGTPPAFTTYASLEVVQTAFDLIFAQQQTIEALTAHCAGLQSRLEALEDDPPMLVLRPALEPCHNPNPGKLRPTEESAKERGLRRAEPTQVTPRHWTAGEQRHFITSARKKQG